ncbi:MAG: hypothetical protein AAF086_08560 [Planctomycetota bacterium]
MSTVRYVLAAAITAAAVYTTPSHAGTDLSLFDGESTAFLPNYNPFEETLGEWVIGESVGTWSDGIPRIIDGETLSGDGLIVTDLSEYLELGLSLCVEGDEISELICSEQDLPRIEFLPNYNPFEESQFDWFTFQSEGLWVDGLVNILAGENLIDVATGEVIANNAESYLNFGIRSGIQGDELSELRLSNQIVPDFDGGGAIGGPNAIPTPSALAGGLLLIGGLATRRHRKD